MTEKPSLLLHEQEKNTEPGAENKIYSELSYDERSFMWNGQRVFLNSATIHYFRMPREEWRKVLIKAKLAGMNCIDTYFAWNVHEPEEGQWVLDGDRDCGAFLDLCAELGMWVIARPGPFICAEWDFGGFPYWLETKPNIKFRENNETYLHYVDLYFDRIVPIIRERQISAGGSVILVQVENEYGYLMNDAAASDHMNVLRDGLLRRGIDVPLITCVGGAEGTIEGANFWSGADGHYAKLRAKQPDTPKMVTEFWTGWFENWGGPSAIQKTAPLMEKRLMEILRAGYTGISHYMFYGGTNFGGYGGRTVGSSDIFMVTSYDYDAPLNEYGRVTPKYAVTKKWSYFVNTFGAFLMESEEVPEAGINVHLPQGVSLRGRRAGNQNIWFLESFREERETLPITLEEGRTLPVVLNPGQIVPVFHRVRIADDVFLTSGALITGNEIVNGERTLFIVGDTGQRSVVELEAPSLRVISSSMQLLLDHDPVSDVRRLDLFHFREPGTVRLEAGGVPLRIIVLDSKAMDRTWRIEGTNPEQLRYAIGLDEVVLLPSGQVRGMISDMDRTILLLGGWTDGEQSLTGRDLIDWDAVAEFSGAGDAGDHKSVTGTHQLQLTMPPMPPKLSDSPDVSRVTLEAEGRSPSGQPEHFAQYGQDYGYLLYECDFHSDAGGSSHLILPGLQDTARIYVNGVEQALVRQVGAAGVNVRTAEGTNRLQILVQHMGRLNFSPFLGESKGLAGPVYLGGSVQDIRRDWQAAAGMVHLDEVNDLEGNPLLSRSFTLDGMDRAILVGAVSKGLRINGIDVPMGGYQDWFSFHTVDLSPYVKSGEVNTLEMTYSQAPLNRLELILYRNEDELSNWRMAGSEAILPQQWGTLTPDPSNKSGNPEANSLFARHGGNGTANPMVDRSSGQPVWYRWRFSRPIVSEFYEVNLMLRLTGMSKGTLHLNGHHLGRYWQIGPQEDYKIPVSWLQEENELLVFDEEGCAPDRIRLLYDEPSRYPWFVIG
ncbi:beta-galactosidase [Paenibacillus sp. MABNR03]|uniref:beta-galactosidase n=1 Tax=Paenibacillus sp. MABNR03 TaxID=3142626 RepID=UPI003D272AE2